MTDPLPCPTPKSGEIEAERSGADKEMGSSRTNSGGTAPPKSDNHNHTEGEDQ